METYIIDTRDTLSYITIGEGAEFIDQGRIVDGVLVSTLDQLKGQLRRMEPLDAPLIIGQSYQVASGERFDEKVNVWERVDSADRVVIAGGLQQAIEVDEELRRAGLNYPVLTECGYWERWKKDAKRLKGKTVYVLGEPGYFLPNAVFKIDRFDVDAPHLGGVPVCGEDEKEVLKLRAALRERVREREAQRMLRSVGWEEMPKVPDALSEAEGIAAKFGVHPLAPTLIMAATFGGFQGANVCIDRGDGFFYPMTYNLLIGESGTGKTPILNMVTEHLITTESAEAHDLSIAFDRALEECSRALGGRNYEKALERKKEVLRLYREVYQHPYITGYGSSQGLEKTLSRSSYLAECLEVPCPGTILVADDTPRLFNPTQGVGYALDQLARLGKLIEPTLNSGETLKGDGASSAYGDRLISVTTVAATTPKASRSLLNEILAGQGGYNRFNMVYLEQSKTRGLNKTTLHRYRSLFQLQRGAFQLEGTCCPSDNEYEEMCDRVGAAIDADEKPEFPAWLFYAMWKKERLGARCKELSNDSDPEAAYVAKSEAYCLSWTLIFHLINELDAGRVPSTIIPFCTVARACAFTEALWSAREKAYRALTPTQVESKRLSPEARHIMRYAQGKGWLDVDTLRNAKFNKTKIYGDQLRGKLDEELIEAGVWYIGKHEHKGKRILIEV